MISQIKGHLCKWRENGAINRLLLRRFFAKHLLHNEGKADASPGQIPSNRQAGDTHKMAKRDPFFVEQLLDGALHELFGNQESLIRDFLQTQRKEIGRRILIDINGTKQCMLWRRRQQNKKGKEESLIRGDCKISRSAKMGLNNVL